MGLVMIQKYQSYYPDSPLSAAIIKTLKRVPPGKVATYGQIAALSGNPLAARQVVRILHACSDKYRLPWHRIIGSKGKISLQRGLGYETQRAFLKKEGIKFGKNDSIDLSIFQWSPLPRKKLKPR